MTRRVNAGSEPGRPEAQPHHSPPAAIELPELCLVLLLGASGSGKSSFARRLFKPTEIVSSDACRALVSDDENDQAVTPAAFELARSIVAKRLSIGRLTVVDATNTRPDAREPFLELAKRYHVPAVAIALALPEELCLERQGTRPERNVAEEIVLEQTRRFREALPRLAGEGYASVHVLSSAAEIEGVRIVRERLPCNRREERGPFDIIGDVHGCMPELDALLEKLGYRRERTEADWPTAVPPGGRKAIFLGDLVDRGPDVCGVLKLAMSMVEAGTALCLPGNHEMKLLRKLKGHSVKIAHGLAQSLAQLSEESPEFVERVTRFIEGLTAHYVLDGGKLVVAHAGLRAGLQGRVSKRVRDFALYGETTGEIDEVGLPVRYNWAVEYDGRATVVYGHTPLTEARWVNDTICIDTGCVFGGRLTALRYPERELVSVPAVRAYSQPARPLASQEERMRVPPRKEPKAHGG